MQYCGTHFENHFISKESSNKWNKFNDQFCEGKNSVFFAETYSIHEVELLIKIFGNENCLSFNSINFPSMYLPFQVLCYQSVIVILGNAMAFTPLIYFKCTLK